ncbi:MAG: ribosome maturation factor RimP [Thermanaeromonas sp.]|nr:ribosome maturation factor RimP [Thermanaeromonas sp.]MCG0277258.1 ribosome maturation factor RimP [Thermanaeromonas sp.]
MSKIAAAVEGLVAPIIERMGYELVDVEYCKEGQRYFLRIFIDGPDGITLEDCERVSEVVGEELDRVDPIPHSYYLEVSSPGVERPLKKDTDYQRFRGRLVSVQTFAPVEGRKRFEGRLLGLEGDEVHILSSTGEHFRIPRPAIARARLKYEPGKE